MDSTTDLYCTLTPQQQKIRRSLVRAKIVPLVRAVYRANSSLRLEFVPSSGNREMLEEFIELERSCCGFLGFSVSKTDEELSLLIEGPPEAAHILDRFHKTIQGERQ